jgi:hypothetical protein
MRRVAAGLTLAACALIGCSSPGDVTADHERSVADLQRQLNDADAVYHDKLAIAQEWNEHVWGIPAAGWVTILSIVGVLALALVGVIVYLVARAREERRNQRHQLALEREKTLRVATERGVCPTCGAQPLTELTRPKKEYRD